MASRQSGSQWSDWRPDVNRKSGQALRCHIGLVWMTRHGNSRAWIDRFDSNIQARFIMCKDTFRDRLLNLLNKVTQPATGPKNRTEDALREHGEKEAERIVRRSLKSTGLVPNMEALTKLPKSDPRKAALALLLREWTSVGNRWIAEKLAMGHPTQ